jgi:hypothetical protein
MSVKQQAYSDGSTVVSFTALVDKVVINSIEINRGSCATLNYLNSQVAKGINPDAYPFGPPTSDLPKTLEFGETLTEIEKS